MGLNVSEMGEQANPLPTDIEVRDEGVTPQKPLIPGARKSLVGLDARQRKRARRRRRWSQGELSFLVNSGNLPGPGIGLPGDGAETLVKHVGFLRVWCAADGP
jgi:hypothetical protein